MLWLFVRVSLTHFVASRSSIFRQPVNRARRRRMLPPFSINQQASLCTPVKFSQRSQSKVPLFPLHFSALVRCQLNTERQARVCNLLTWQVCCWTALHAADRLHQAFSYQWNEPEPGRRNLLHYVAFLL